MWIEWEQAIAQSEVGSLLCCTLSPMFAIAIALRGLYGATSDCTYWQLNVSTENFAVC